MDNNNGKIRNFKAESRILFILDAVLIIAAVAAAFILFPATGKIGIRNKLILGILNAAFSLIFMGTLEKYSDLPTDLREKRVITLLSLFYNFVIMGIINLWFFASLQRLAADAFIFVLSAVLIIIKDFIFTKVVENPDRFRRPNLFILCKNVDNLPRTRNIKYGMDNYFNGWYEKIEGMTGDEIREFVQKNFPLYDAVCVFDDISEDVYHIISDEAVKANKSIFIVPRIPDISKTHSKLVHLDDIMTLYIPKYNITAVESFVKRLMDIVISFD